MLGCRQATLTATVTVVVVACTSSTRSSVYNAARNAGLQAADLAIFGDVSLFLVIYN